MCGDIVSPGTATGGGLKRRAEGRQPIAQGFPRDRNRGRIETLQPAFRRSPSSFPRDRNRGRIETGAGARQCRHQDVSPGTATGGGLKHVWQTFSTQTQTVSPGTATGGGLKPIVRNG